METTQQRILVADDNPVIRDVICHNLQQHGFCAESANDGPEAARIFDSMQFDAIITDFQMPGFNGGELCRHVRAQDRNSDIPIFLLTAKGYELDIEQLSKELSLSEVFFKPFSPKDIVDSIQATLAKKPDCTTTRHTFSTFLTVSATLG